MFQSICAILLAAVATIETVSLVQWTHSMEMQSAARSSVTYVAQAGPASR